MRPSRFLPAFLVLGSAAFCPAQSPIEVSSVLLKLVEEVDVPAEQAGVLRDVAVREGEIVKAGQRLAQVDDEAARMTEQKASMDVRIAECLARDRLPVEIARKSLDQQHQKLQQLTLEERMASRQAENIFRVQAADKAHAVAENELQRAKKAKTIADAAVSLSEIEGLQLESEKAGLEAQQSRFEKEIDGLKTEVVQEGLRGQELAVGAAELEVAKAEAEYEVAQLQVGLKQQEHGLARLDVSRRQVVSPIDGVVVEIFQQRGEWVEPGQKVLRILRLDRLWVEGFIRVEDLSKCVEQSRVTVSIPLSADETAQVEGRIVFVGREVDPVNREVLIRAEIGNEDLRLLPGMDGQMLIHGERPAQAQAPRNVEKLPARVVDRLQTIIEINQSLGLRDALILIGERTGVAFEIDSDALKSGGFTQNMRQDLRLGRVSALEALRKIVFENRAQLEEYQLCFVVDDARNTVLLTTVSFAKKAGQKVFQFPAAANGDGTATAGAADIFQRKDAKAQ